MTAYINIGRKGGQKNQPVGKLNNSSELLIRTKVRKYSKLARSQLTRLVKITTGHNALAYHSYKIDNTIDPICRLCGEDIETFFHFATDCPRLRETRTDIFADKDITDSWAVGHILELSHVPAIDALLSWE